MKWDKGTKLWYADRYNRAREQWSNYSKWTTILQRDIDQYEEKHKKERGSIEARLVAQGYDKDSPVWQQAITTMEMRQQADVAEATQDLANIKEGVTRDILIGDGSVADRTPYGEYLIELKHDEDLAKIRARNEKAREEAGTFTYEDDLGNTVTAQRKARVLVDDEWVDVTRERVTKELTTVDKSHEAGTVNMDSLISQFEGRDDVMSMEEFYTEQYGTWKESPEEIASRERAEATGRSKTLSGGQRAFKQAPAEKGMAGGRAVESEFDLGSTGMYGEEEEDTDILPATGLV